MEGSTKPRLASRPVRRVQGAPAAPPAATASGGENAAAARAPAAASGPALSSSTAAQPPQPEVTRKGPRAGDASTHRPARGPERPACRPPWRTRAAGSFGPGRRWRDASTGPGRSYQNRIRGPDLTLTCDG